MEMVSVNGGIEGPNFLIESTPVYLTSNNKSSNKSLQIPSKQATAKNPIEPTVSRTRSAPPRMSKPSRNWTGNVTTTQKRHRGYSADFSQSRGHGYSLHRGVPSSTPLSVNVPQSLVELYRGLALASTRPVTASDNFRTRQEAKLLLRQYQSGDTTPLTQQRQRLLSSTHDSVEHNKFSRSKSSLMATSVTNPHAVSKTRVYNLNDHIVSNADVLNAPPVSASTWRLEDSSDGLDSASLVSLRSDDSALVQSIDYEPDMDSLTSDESMGSPRLAQDDPTPLPVGTYGLSCTLGFKKNRRASTSVVTPKRSSVDDMGIKGERAKSAEFLSPRISQTNESDLISLVAKSQLLTEANPTKNETTEVKNGTRRISITLPSTSEEDSRADDKDAETRKQDCSLCIFCREEGLMKSEGPHKTLSPRIVESRNQQKDSKPVPFTLAPSKSLQSQENSGNAANNEANDIGVIDTYETISHKSSSNSTTKSTKSNSHENFLDLKGTKVKPKHKLETPPNISMITDQHGKNLAKKFHPPIANFRYSKNWYVDSAVPENDKLTVSKQNADKNMNHRRHVSLSVYDMQKRQRESMLQMRHSYANRAELHPRPVSRVEAQRFLDRCRVSSSLDHKIISEDDLSMQDMMMTGQPCPPNSPTFEFTEPGTEPYVN